jgi:hypothetical protein
MGPRIAAENKRKRDWAYKYSWAEMREEKKYFF